MVLPKRKLHRFINRNEEDWFKRQHDLECLNRNTESFIKHYEKTRQKRYKKSKKFLEKRLGPFWYQELSWEQVEVADQLFDAIQDCKIPKQTRVYIENFVAKYEKNRISAVRKLLLDIGIKPLPNRNQMKYAIKFSRGNDLALLWFLFEMVYCTDDDHEKIRKYSVNERLLLTCICHLDMITTLRELDQLLPKKEALIEQDPNCNSKVLKKVKSTDNFPKLKLVPFKTRKFPKPKYAIYSAYKNPEFVVKNEANRWFADGNLKKKDEVKIAEHVLRDSIKEATRIKDEKSEALCPKHQEEQSEHNKILKKLKEFQKFQEGNYNRDDPDDLKREGLIYGLEMNVNEANEKSEEAEKNFQSRTVVRRLLRKILEGSLDRDHITQCSDCLKATQKGKNQEGIKLEKACEEKPLAGPNKCSLETPAIEKNSVDGEFFISFPETCEFRFDYDKIFSGYHDSSDLVKKCINATLNIDKYYSEDAAISACLEAMWKNELGSWEHKDQLNTYLNNNFVIVQGKEDFDSPKKCFQLLKKALTIMKKDPKFVLASLPDADKVPILREWVLIRYGFRHTIDEERKKRISQKYHMSEVMLSGAAPLTGKLKKCPQLRNFGVRKKQKTVDKFVKLVPRVTIQPEVAASFPCMEQGFLISDSNCRLMTPNLYMFRPYSRR